jgi:hypothetical protein
MLSKISTRQSISTISHTRDRRKLDVNTATTYATTSRSALIHQTSITVSQRSVLIPRTESASVRIPPSDQNKQPKRTAMYASNQNLGEISRHTIYLRLRRCFYDASRQRWKKISLELQKDGNALLSSCEVQGVSRIVF